MNICIPVMKESDKEDAKSVDDKLAGTKRIDVCGRQISLTHPLCVLHIDVGLAVVST
jgi:hypothetical protein